MDKFICNLWGYRLVDFALKFLAYIYILTNSEQKDTDLLNLIVCQISSNLQGDSKRECFSHTMQIKYLSQEWHVNKSKVVPVLN